MASFAFSKSERLFAQNAGWRTFDLTTLVEVLRPSGTTHVWLPAALISGTPFVAWYSAEPRPPFSRAVVQQYRSVLESAGLAPASINLRLSAIRKLAEEAAENGWLDRSVAQGIGYRCEKQADQDLIA